MFFVERTGQLLKEGGRAAIILPSSILSNDSVLHFETRKILLEYFNIKAIASFGNGTFGATGTNTVILFLEKRNKNFSKERKRVSEVIFENPETDIFADYLNMQKLLKMFTNYRNLNLEDYKSFINKQSNENIIRNSFYLDYQNWFDNLTKIKNLKKKVIFQSKNEEEQKRELEKLFYNEALAIEQEKFYFFMLTLKDDFRKKETNGKAYKHQKTVIVQSGEKETAKAFLGYEFSNRKGSEGIKINRNEKGQAINKMSDDNDHLNQQKANSYILKHFEKQTIDSIDENISEHVKVAKLTDMLDFEKVKLNNAISLNPKINNEIESKWEMVNLGEVCTTQYGYTAKAKDIGEIRYLRITDINEEGTLKSKNKKYINLPQEVKKDFLLKEEDIVVARSGSTGRMFLYKNIDEKLIFASYLVRLNLSEKILPQYLFAFYNTNFYWEQVNNLTETLAQPNLNAEKIKQIKIPLPPLKVQQKIVTACEEIDKKVGQAQEEIKICKEKIESSFPKVNNEIESKWEMVKLGEHFKFLQKSKRLSNEGKEKGKYPFFTSSITQDKFIDTADYLEECLIIGDGGVPNIHISKNFSTGQHSLCFKIKY